MVASPCTATLRSSSNVASTSDDTLGSTPPGPFPPSDAASLARRSLSVLATRRSRCTSACASDCPMRTLEAAGSRGLVAAPPIPPPPRPRAPPPPPPPPQPPLLPAAANAPKRPPDVGDTVKRGGGGGGGGDTAGESDVRIILGRLNTLRTGPGGVDRAAAGVGAAAAAAAPAAAAAEEESRFPEVAAEAPPWRTTGCRGCWLFSSDAVRRPYFEADGALPFFFSVPMANFADRVGLRGNKTRGVGCVVLSEMRTGTT